MVLVPTGYILPTLCSMVLLVKVDIPAPWSIMDMVYVIFKILLTF